MTRHFTPATATFIGAAGNKLVADVFGESGDPVLLLHGGGQTRHAWSKTAAAIAGKAPLSLKLALAQMQRGRDWSFEDCMRAEWRIVSRVAYGEDFYEGIRALIIDKENRPRWRSATLAEVGEAEIERHFAPLADELILP